MTAHHKRVLFILIGGPNCSGVRFISTPPCSGPKPSPEEKAVTQGGILRSVVCARRTRLSRVLRHAPRPLAPAEANLATCAPREPPATGRCCYGFPAPSALQGCFLNLPTEAFDEAFSSGGLLTTEPCATVTTMPCPTPRPAVRRRRWRSTRPRTSSTSRRQRCAYLPPDLCPSASLTGAMPRSGAVLVGL